MGSVLLGFDDAALSTGLLLLPPKPRTKLAPPPSSVRLGVVGAAPGAERQPLSPDGFPSLFVSGTDFEASLIATATPLQLASPAVGWREIG